MERLIRIFNKDYRFLRIRNLRRFRKRSKQIIVSIRGVDSLVCFSPLLHPLSPLLQIHSLSILRAHASSFRLRGDDEATSSTIRDEKSFRVAWSLFPSMNNKGEALSTQVPEKKLILDLFSRVERNDTFLFSWRIIRFHPRHDPSTTHCTLFLHSFIVITRELEKQRKGFRGFHRVVC